jgi:hypothetical protein
VTTGSYTDNRYYTVTGLVYTPCVGAPFPAPPMGEIGWYSKRDWSGADSVLSPAQAGEWRSFRYRLHVKGKPSAVKTFWFRYWRKRNQQLSENSYTTTAIRKRNVVLMSGSACAYPYGNWDNGPVNSQSIAGYNDRPWTANDDIELLARLRQQIQGQGFNLAVTLGESRESLNTITESAQRLRRAIEFLRGGKVRKAARSVLVKPTKRMRDISRREVTQEWVASNWLQLQYGVLPLLADVKGAAEHLAALMNRPVHHTYRASFKMKPRPIATPPGSWIAPVGMCVDGCAIKAIVTSIDEISLVGLKDPASLLWEKLAYSFVADWFIPVGDYLEARMLASSLTATYVKTRLTKEAIYRAVPADPRARIDDTPFLKESVYMARTVTPTLAVPLPQLKPLSQAATWKHAANAVALLINAFSR